MIIELKSLTTKGCCFELDDETDQLYKICRVPAWASTYYNGFRCEFEIMHRLNGSVYFPTYYEFSKSRLHRIDSPYICMDYIRGETLESLLQRRGERNNFETGILFPLLSDWEIHRLFEQLFDVMCILCNNGILYFDLNPCNIIIINDHFDLRLVDFTFCCDHRKNRETAHWKAIDGSVHRDWPYSLLLEESFLLLFTRLFYPGDTEYARHFARTGSAAEPVSRYFRDHYGQLLHLLFFEDGCDTLSDRIESGQHMDAERNYTALVSNWIDFLFTRIPG